MGRRQLFSPSCPSPALLFPVRSILSMSAQSVDISIHRQVHTCILEYKIVKIPILANLQLATCMLQPEILPYAMKEEHMHNPLTYGNVRDFVEQCSKTLSPVILWSCRTHQCLLLLFSYCIYNPFILFIVLFIAFQIPVYSVPKSLSPSCLVIL